MKFRDLHKWDLTPKEGVLLQQELVSQLTIRPLDRPLRFVAGVDISCSKGDKRLFAAVVVLDIETLEIVEIAEHIEEACFPYVPGLLSFREIPPLLEAFKKLNIIPDAVICDGHGIAHPRGMGLAAHLGLWLQIPTIGCAKKRLIGEYLSPAIEKGAQTPLVYKKKNVGIVLRTKKNIKPLFISPGHLIDIPGSVILINRCLNRFRLPEATRQAHLAVNRLRVETFLSERSILGLS